MITIPENSSTTFKILGIDPGTTNLGLAVMMVDIKTALIVDTVAYTLNANKIISRDTWNSNIHSDRFDRILSLKKSVLNLLQHHQPNIVSCESPFFGRSHPNAFQALTEILTAIRDALYEYSPWIELTLVSPSVVKQAVLAKGNATKDIMKEKVQLLAPELNLNYNNPFERLDEHSIDAISVAYYAYTQYKSYL